jgi:hypothetical protein
MLAIRGETCCCRQDPSAMAARHPDFESITVAGQGHAPFLESGDLPARIANFFNRADR